MTERERERDRACESAREKERAGRESGCKQSKNRRDAVEQNKMRIQSETEACREGQDEKDRMRATDKTERLCAREAKSGTAHVPKLGTATTPNRRHR